MSNYIFPLANMTLANTKITSKFGLRAAPTAGASSNHKGVDLAAAAGTGVLAAAPGKVIFSGYDKNKGNYIQIEHINGDITEYEHLNTLGVQPGAAVKGGAKIGTVGSTGTSTGPHLHFGVISGGKYIDPLTWGGVSSANIPGLPGGLSSSEWFKNVTKTGTPSGVTPGQAATSTAGGAFDLDLGGIGSAALGFVEKYFIWIIAGLLVFAILSKRR